MTDNELMALAMTGSEEKGHNSTASFKKGEIKSNTRLRVWMANNRFYPSVLRNNMQGNIVLEISHKSYEEVNGNWVPVNKNEELTVPLSVYVSLFFNPENYDPICEIESDNLEVAFDLCGNNPTYSERWSNFASRRSLSCGDVVEVIKDGKSEFFVCASFGWDKLSCAMSPLSKLNVINPKDWRG